MTALWPRHAMIAHAALAAPLIRYNSSAARERYEVAGERGPGTATGYKSDPAASGRMAENRLPPGRREGGDATEPGESLGKRDRRWERCCPAPLPWFDGDRQKEGKDDVKRGSRKRPHPVHDLTAEVLPCTL